MEFWIEIVDLRGEEIGYEDGWMKYCLFLGRVFGDCLFVGFFCCYDFVEECVVLCFVFFLVREDID